MLAVRVECRDHRAAYFPRRPRQEFVMRRHRSLRCWRLDQQAELLRAGAQPSVSVICVETSFEKVGHDRIHRPALDGGAFFQPPMKPLVDARDQLLHSEDDSKSDRECYHSKHPVGLRRSPRRGPP